MFDTIRGLPLHPLAVHAVVVLLPLAAILTTLVAARPGLRRWTVYLMVFDGAVSVATFVAIQSGEALERRVRQFSDPAGLWEHQRWGKILFILSFALFAGSVLLHLLRERSGLMRVLAVLAAIGGVTVIGLTVYVGEGGASMVWRDIIANTKVAAHG